MKDPVSDKPVSDLRRRMLEDMALLVERPTGGI